MQCFDASLAGTALRNCLFREPRPLATNRWLNATGDEANAILASQGTLHGDLPQRALSVLSELGSWSLLEEPLPANNATGARWSSGTHLGPGGIVKWHSEECTTTGRVVLTLRFRTRSDDVVRIRHAVVSTIRDGLQVRAVDAAGTRWAMHIKILPVNDDFQVTWSETDLKIDVMIGGP
eukprot:TRINITY_DN71330_c0_g1_i1.p1 TRINITY_DN71330_c0_g1~~TRINITY_DN71330_c0_g1_i1.p1  ORF type:complete len:179 (+),score=22.04 TRINITY_DN71330_c0_g1_i1:52-588(+)